MIRAETTMDALPATSAGAGDLGAPGPHAGADGPIPPGWAYNPSNWSERLPLVGVALIGFGIASYLALYQLGVLASVWEPFFGDGSRVVLTSGLSRALPIPDAALGALDYLVDALGGVIGGRARWRTAPWMALLFGLSVGPLGLVSVLLVIAQPVVYGAFCTLCLVSAFISINLIGPAMDETLASLQHLKRERARGRSLWGALWGLDTREA